MQLIIQRALNEVLLNTFTAQFQALSMAIQYMSETPSSPGTPDNLDATQHFKDQRMQAQRKAETAAEFVKVGFAVAVEGPYPYIIGVDADELGPPSLCQPRNHDAITELANSGLATAHPKEFARPILCTNCNTAGCVEPSPVPHLSGHNDAIDLAEFRLSIVTTRTPEKIEIPPVMPPSAPEAPPTESTQEPSWIKPGKSVQVAGIAIPDGMVYLGTERLNVFQARDPCIIDQTAPVLNSGDGQQINDLGYWPHYSGITPKARHGYLKWLSSGRCDRQVNIGYIYLFFYGLERRALTERRAMLASLGEREAIIAEVERLLHIYQSSLSFEGYALSFLLYLRSLQPGWRAYNEEPAGSRNQGMVPAIFALALGQFSADKISLSAQWALRWVRAAHNITKRTTVIRYADHFDTLFIERYQQQHPTGYMLENNKALLSISYKPASSAFRGQNFELTLGDIPDVTMLTRHINMLQALVDTCTRELEPYSRARGASPTITMLLPPLLWPAALRAALNAVRESIVTDFYLVPADEVFACFSVGSPYPLEEIAAVTIALAAIGVGIEPATIPLTGNAGNVSAKICLFKITPVLSNIAFPPAFIAAKVTLALASIFIKTKVTNPSQSTDYLLARIETWPELTSHHRQRLRAYRHVVLDQPPSLQVTLKRLSGTAPELAREICQLLCALTLADGVVMPNKRIMLGKIYTSLSLSLELVDADLFDFGYRNVSLAGASGAIRTDKESPPARSELAAAIPSDVPDARSNRGSDTIFNHPAGGTATASAPSLRLDVARVAQIIKDTEQVARLLAPVFEPEPECELGARAVAKLETETASDLEATPKPDPASIASGRIGDGTQLMELDAAHSNLVRQLLTRPKWSRQELQRVASVAGLMLSGALERINDACFEHLNCALVDGEDPIEVNLELKEEIL